MENKHKATKNTRSLPKRLLMYTEGKHEKAFLNYLKQYLYKDTVRGCGQQTDIIASADDEGGSPQVVLEEAITMAQQNKNRRKYNKIIVIVDRDRMGNKNEVAKLKKQAKENNVTLVVFEPCLEALLLSIIDGSKDLHNEKCWKLKKRFESKYLSRVKRSRAENYKLYFPLEKLEKTRKKKNHNARKLDFLIRAMHNEVDLEKEI